MSAQAVSTTVRFQQPFMYLWIKLGNKLITYYMKNIFFLRQGLAMQFGLVLNLLCSVN